MKAFTIAILVAIVSIIILPPCACQTETLTSTLTTTAYATSTLVKTISASAPPTTPKLSSAAVALSITTPAEYAAYSIPVYLTRKQTLHLNWKSDGGGFQMKVTTPGGYVVSAGAQGVNSSDTTEQLGYLGGFDFCPGDRTGDNWVDGYYYFVPTIFKGSPPIKLTVTYWIEN
jgi:hypothetical protein